MPRDWCTAVSFTDSCRRWDQWEADPVRGWGENGDPLPRSRMGREITVVQFATWSMRDISPPGKCGLGPLMDKEVGWMSVSAGRSSCVTLLGAAVLSTTGLRALGYSCIVRKCDTAYPYGHGQQDTLLLGTLVLAYHRTNQHGKRPCRGAPVTATSCWR
jgi:hypothetical protein